MLTYAEISAVFTNSREERQLPGIARVWEYLAKRGIDRATADACQLHIMPAVELIAAARRANSKNVTDTRAAVVFPHFKFGDVGSPIEWWSSRLVATAPELRVVTSFADYIDPEKVRTPGKMFCPPNEPPRAYLPPLYGWGQLKKGDRVYIHESAIKAINGAVLGKPSIGLNGVWGWMSKKHNVALVEDLRDLPWKALQLQPVIVFDSNAWDKWQVQEAENRLAAKLQEVTGRTSIALRVPKGPTGEDQGFDDYRATMGDAAALEFLNGDGIEIDIGEVQQLMLRLNSEVCVVRELGRIADQTTGDLMTRPVFTEVNYANFVVSVEDGENTRTVNVPKLWLSSNDRVEAQSIEYSPGKDKLIDKGDDSGLPNLNTWRGMGLDPEPGDVEPWLELLANNIEDDNLRQWVMAWCAYPLQNLGRKLNTYLLVFGPSGTGKNLFFKPLHHIYGRNAVILDTDAVKSQFTSLYAQRQFVHADELVRSKGEDDLVSQRIKALVTQDKLKVNRKGQPEYEIDNHTNLVITSNYWDCVKLDQDDRRACVIRWGTGGLDRRGDQVYWQNYVRWADSGWGPAALYHFLLNMDISWFDPAAWAPPTFWKEEVKIATMSPVDQWVKDLLENPEMILPLPGKDRAVWTARELAMLYYGEAESEMSPTKVKSMSNALRNRGFVQAAEGKLVRRPGGAPERWWVIQDKHLKWDTEAVAKHLRKMLGT